MEKIKVLRLRENARIPTYGSLEAAGADLYACLDEVVTVGPGETVWIPTGIALELPIGVAGLIYARSGMATKQDLAPANKVGVIDSDYRGEITVVLHNHGKQTRQIACGERIAQLVITPVFTPGFMEANSLNDTVRGKDGFGSTGK